MTKGSDSYLSQVERGLYQPSPVVLSAIARGLGISPEALFPGWAGCRSTTAPLSRPA